MSLIDFPSLVDSFTDIDATTDDLDTAGVEHDDMHNKVNQAVVAIEQLLAAWFNQFNVMDPTFGGADGGSAATNTSAFNAARAAVVASGKLGMVYVPAGVDLPVTPGGVLGTSNVIYWGEGTISTVQTSAGALITFPAGSTNFAVRGLTFKSPNDSIVAVYVKSATSSMSTDFRIVDNRCIECRMVDTNDLTLTYSTVSTNISTGNVTRDVYIHGNRGTRTSTPTTASAFILLFYTIGGTITNNRCTGYVYLIQWWGGDANTAVNGVLASERRCGRFTISNNYGYSLTGAGVWGSMGFDIEGWNHIDGCGDVGHDSEGGVNVHLGGTARNCTNGGIAAFFFNRTTVFNVTVETDAANGNVALIANSAQDRDNRDVTVKGAFTCNSGIGVFSAQVVQSLNIDATFTNVRIDAASNNQGDVTMRGKVLFTTVAGAAVTAVKTGYTHGCINDIAMTIVSTVTQPVGSRAVATINIVAGANLINCKIRGWGTTPVRVEFTGSNPGDVSETWVSGYIGEGTGIDRVESGTGGAVAKVWMENLKNNVGARSIPSAIPARSDVGQIVWYPAPTASGKIGAVCVTAGAPGTYKDFGPIDA